MATFEALKAIDAANAAISIFLENAPPLSESNGGAGVDLSGLQDQIPVLMITIQNAGRHLEAAQLPGLDTSARAEIDLYARNLERLKQFLTALRSYAEMRRDHLAIHSRKVSEVLAWCNAVKLSNLE
jgi:hypothetical protein